MAQKHPSRNKSGRSSPPRTPSQSSLPPRGGSPRPKGSGGLVLGLILAALLAIVVARVVHERWGGPPPLPDLKTSLPSSKPSDSKEKLAKTEPSQRPSSTPPNPSPFLDAAALKKVTADPSLEADYRRAATFATGDNSRGASPLLERLRARTEGKAVAEEIAALTLRAAATSDSPDTALTLARDFRKAHPQSRYLAQVDVAEGKAWLVLGKRASGDREPGDPSPPPPPALENLVKAEAAFARAVKSADPDAQAEARFSLGTVLSQKGDHSGALAAWKEVVAFHPTDPRAPKALSSAAASAWQRDDLDQARSLFDDLIRQYPTDPAAKRARSDRSALNVVGRPAAEISASRWMPGTPHPLSSLKGRAVLLVFWATWCPHCREEMPAVKKLYERYRERGLEIVAVTRHSKGQTDEDVANYMKEQGIPFPVAIDAGGATSSAYGVSGIPAAALVDPAGKVVWRNHPSRLTDADLDKVLPRG